MIKEKRKDYIDGLKCLAIFIIFLTHFVVCFESDYIRFWSEPPLSFLLKGMDGQVWRRNPCGMPGILCV